MKSFRGCLRANKEAFIFKSLTLYAACQAAGISLGQKKIWKNMDKSSNFFQSVN